MFQDSKHSVWYGRLQFIHNPLSKLKKKKKGQFHIGCVAANSSVAVIECSERH